MGGAQNVPLGEHVGWEERSETRIPETIDVKGVSGKGAVKGTASHVTAVVALRASPDHSAARGQTHPRPAAVDRNQYGGSSVCQLRYQMVPGGTRGFRGSRGKFCLLFFAVSRKRQDPGSDGGLEGLSSSAGSQGWLRPPENSQSGVFTNR